MMMTIKKNLPHLDCFNEPINPNRPMKRMAMARIIIPIMICPD